MRYSCPMNVRIRPAELADRDELVAFARAELEGRPYSTLPLVSFVAEAEDGRLAGFIEVGLRSHADACDGRRAVGFIEGWFVSADFRRQGIGRALVDAAE